MRRVARSGQGRVDGQRSRPPCFRPRMRSISSDANGGCAPRLKPRSALGPPVPPSAGAQRHQRVQGRRPRARGPGGAQRRDHPRRQHRHGPVPDLLLPGAQHPHQDQQVRRAQRAAAPRRVKKGLFLCTRALQSCMATLHRRTRPQLSPGVRQQNTGPRLPRCLDPGVPWRLCRTWWCAARARRSAGRRPPCWPSWASSPSSTAW